MIANLQIIFHTPKTRSATTTILILKSFIFTIRFLGIKKMRNFALR